MAPTTRAGNSQEDVGDLPQNMNMEQLLQILQRLQPSNNPNSGTKAFDPFKEDEETFSTYKRRLNNFMELNNIRPEKKTLVLLNSLNTKHFQLLEDLTRPDSPNSKTYDELIGLLETHLCPSTNEISEQHKFGMIRQKELQSISNYIAELKKASTFCNFKCDTCNNSTLNTHLRSQFIRGLRDDDIRERLLIERQITFDEAVKIACAIEASKENNKIIQEYQSRIQIHQQVTESNKKIICYKCATIGHTSDKCQKRNLKCSKCKKWGHVDSVCRTKMNRIHANELDTQENECIEPEIYNIQLPLNSDKICISMIVENRSIKFEFDTGSAITTMNESNFKHHFPNLQLQPSKLQIKVYNKELVPIVGETIVNVEFNNQVHNLPIYIVPSGLDSICGRNWINAFNILHPIGSQSCMQISSNIINNQQLTERIIDEFKTVFQDTIGTIPNVKEYVLPITSTKIAEETQKDEQLKEVYNALINGNKIQNQDYKGKENQLMIQNKCMYLGERVIIPKSLQRFILDELHIGHIGIVRMKWLARSYCYWTRIDHDIEMITKNCRGCAMVAKEPNKVLHPWEEPTEPWQRIHIDFAGPFLNKHFLVVVDAKTKWIEVIMMNSITSTLTIRALREIFSRFGLPKVLVSDNGSNFTSFEFKEFIDFNGIIYRKIAPGHPSSNGQAERFVQTIKNGLRSSLEDSKDIHLNLQQLLMQYRKTAGYGNNSSPAQQMLTFKMKSRLDLIKIDKTVDGNQSKPIRKGKSRKFFVGDKVQFRNYQGKPKWKFGTILYQLGNCHYLISHQDMTIKRHIDQILPTNVAESNERRSRNIHL